MRLILRRLGRMNETNIAPRQTAILQLLSSGLNTGSQILVGLRPAQVISKATLMRDLGDLKDKGLIRAEGEGKATRYFLLVSRLLVPVDLEQYFKDGSTLRKAGPVEFNSALFNSLGGKQIFAEQEVEKWKKRIVFLSAKKAVLDPSIYKREIERLTVEFSWKSAKIEGNTYSLLETEVLIKQAKEAFGKSKYEAMMILGHKNAVDYILANPEEFKILEEEKIIKLHNILTEGLGVTSGLRNSKVAITGSEFRPLATSASIKDALAKTVALVNSADFPLAKALLALALISYIQPFVDGNKRTARTLANAILIAHDYYPLSYRNLDEVEYLKATLLFYETNNLYHLKRIVVEQYDFALGNYFLV